MNQTEQQEFIKQMDMADERLRNAGVRIEIVQDFTNFVKKTFENTWKEIATYLDDLHEKHHLTNEEMLMMCIGLEYIQKASIQSFDKAK